jgi:hypothetical protein
MASEGHSTKTGSVAAASCAQPILMMPPVAIKVGKSSQKLLQQIAEEAETAAVTHEQIVLLYEGLAAGIPRAARALLISMVERMREALPNLLDGL